MYNIIFEENSIKQQRSETTGIGGLCVCNPWEVTKLKETSITILLAYIPIEK